MKYELSNEVVNNLMVFLDRVQVKGFQEIQALQEVVNALQNPDNEEIEK